MSSAFRKAPREQFIKLCFIYHSRREHFHFRVIGLDLGAICVGCSDIRSRADTETVHLRPCEKRGEMTGYSRAGSRPDRSAERREAAGRDPFAGRGQLF